MKLWLKSVWLTAVIAVMTGAVFAVGSFGADLSELCLSTAATDPLTLFTYQWVHLDWLHFLVNTLLTVLAGAVVERRCGAAALAITLAGGGLAGGAAFVAVCRVLGVDAVLAGSSAATLAAMVAAAAKLGNLRRFFRLAPVASVAVTLGAVVELLLPVDNPGGAVAHMGGILAGVVAAWLLRRRTDVGTDDADLVARAMQSGFDSLTQQERRRLTTQPRRR